MPRRVAGVTRGARNSKKRNEGWGKRRKTRLGGARGRERDGGRRGEGRGLGLARFSWFPSRDAAGKLRKRGNRARVAARSELRNMNIKRASRIYRVLSSRTLSTRLSALLADSACLLACLLAFVATFRCYFIRRGKRMKPSRAS